MREMPQCDAPLVDIPGVDPHELCDYMEEGDDPHEAAARRAMHRELMTPCSGQVSAAFGTPGRMRRAAESVPM